jgi:hypothetical protein
MNFFIDSNILYDDPYFLKTNKILLDLVEKENANVFLADTVVKEVIENQKIRLKKIIAAYKINKSLLKKITTLELNDDKIEKAEQLEKLISYYNELEKQGKITILKINESVLEYILPKVLNKCAPFFNDSKNEFKDSVIWFTYAVYAKAQKLEDCYLLTDNVKEFGTVENELHPDLYEFYPFKLLRTVILVPNLKNNEISNSSIGDNEGTPSNIREKRINEILFIKHREVLFAQLEYVIEDRFDINHFDHKLSLGKGIIQLMDFRLNSIDNISYSEFPLPTYTGNIKLEILVEILDLLPRRIKNRNSIDFIGEYKKDLVFDFELMVDNLDYILDFSISTVSDNLFEFEDLYDFDNLPF